MRRIMVVNVSMFAMLVAFVAWSSISPVAVQLATHYHLSQAQKGWLIATPVLLGALTRIPVGSLADRFGARRIYALLLLLVAVPLVGISTAHSYEALLLWALCLGVAGSSFVAGITLVSSWYPVERQGFVLGLTAVGNLGSAVAAFGIPFASRLIGWASVERVIAGIVIGFAAIVWLGTRDGSLRAVRTRKNGAVKDGLWMRADLWMLSFQYFITFGGFVAFTGYLPTLYQSAFHFGPILAGVCAGGFVVTATLVRPVGGWMADRLPLVMVKRLVFGLLAVLAGMLAIDNHMLWAASATLFCIAVVLGLGNGYVFKQVPHAFPDSTGRATGIVGAAGALGGFAPPVLLSYSLQWTGNYAGALLGLAVCSALAIRIGSGSRAVDTISAEPDVKAAGVM